MNNPSKILSLAITLALILSGCAFLQSAAAVAAKFAGSQLGMLVLDCAKQSQLGSMSGPAARKTGECIAGPLTWEQGTESDVADRVYVGQLGLEYADAYERAQDGDRQAARELRQLDKALCSELPEMC